jgi:cytoskeletal protein CcmA (bactofilin family)
VKGKLEIAEVLVLKATAVINGDITTGKLVVESGAVFNGTCKMGATIKDFKLTENGTRGLRQEEAKAL